MEYYNFYTHAVLLLEEGEAKAVQGQMHGPTPSNLQPLKMKPEKKIFCKHIYKYVNNL